MKNGFIFFCCMMFCSSGCAGNNVKCLDLVKIENELPNIKSIPVAAGYENLGRALFVSDHVDKFNTLINGYMSSDASLILQKEDYRIKHCAVIREGRINRDEILLQNIGRSWSMQYKEKLNTLVENIPVNVIPGCEKHGKVMFDIYLRKEEIDDKLTSMIRKNYNECLQFGINIEKKQPYTVKKEQEN